METVTQIIHARWLITCEQENKTLANHALVIKDGIIKDILPSKDVTARYTAAETQHFDNHVIMPGFVNAHTHVAMNLLRGYADDKALMDWLNNYIWPAESKWLGSEFVYDASLLAMAEMIRSGTTCFNDMYFFLHDTAKAAELAGIRAHIGVHIMNFPNNWAKDLEEYFTKGLEFYAAYKNHPLVTPTIAAHAIYTVPDSALVRIRDLADELDLQINMHVHETKAEIDQSMAETGKRPIYRLNELGLITPRLIAVHMTQINDEDLAIIAKGKPNIVHCPESNMKLASGIAPLNQFKKAGLNVALGTDGAASNNDLNMLGEMRSAAFLAKIATLEPTMLNAHEALTMATLNGAKALNRDKVTGSLTKGKAADFIAINLDEIETLPIYHPESHIVYAASRNQVSDVFVAGKQLLKNRKLLTLDEEKLKASAERWRQKIAGQATVTV